MLGHDRLVLSCPRTSADRCPQTPCPGWSDPKICAHFESLQAWRARPVEAQHRYFSTGDGGFVPSNEPVRGRVRVGLWSPCLGLGGAEAWQIALARAVNPDRIVWRGAVVSEGHAASHPGMVGELSQRMPVGFGLDAARILASSCDVIVSWAVFDIAGLLRSLEAPPKVVIACHFPGESPWGEGTAELLAGVDRLVAVSELALDSIPDSQRSRAQVIWNAVDDHRLIVRRERATVRDSWGVPREARVVGYLGRLAAEKDPDAMLRLASVLPEPWHLVLVGEGSQRSSLLDRVTNLGLKNVHLVGGDRAVGDVLEAIDHLLVPSRYESFGLSMAEGFWAGVPVIATRSGLAKLEPGLTRSIPIAASGPELFEALLADLADPLGTQTRVEKARAFARDRLSLNRFAREWTDFLVELARPPTIEAIPDDGTNPIWLRRNEPNLAPTERTQSGYRNMPRTLDPDRIGGGCSLFLEQSCPTSPCPGRSDARICDHLASLRIWRTLSTDEQVARLGTDRPAIDPIVRDAVNACPDRGPVLPISEQDDCGCQGRERSECRAGQGLIPGKVTLRECLACQGEGRDTRQ